MVSVAEERLDICSCGQFGGAPRDAERRRAACLASWRAKPRDWSEFGAALRV